MLDFDDFYILMTGLPRYERGSEERLRAVRQEWWQAVKRQARSPRGGWVIATAPRRWQRDAYRKIGYQQVVVVETDADTCMRRARAERPDSWMEAIARWWVAYEPDERDHIVASELLS